MAIIAYGLSYRTAPVELRERIAFPEATLGQSLQELVSDLSGVAEAAIISTCNRTELYCAANNSLPGDADSAVERDLKEWILSNREIQAHELTASTYMYWDQEAARHLMRVAAGLDSQVLGEPQIMGQVKAAYDTARTSGTLGPELNLLSQITLRTAKEVRSKTDIGRNPISVAYAAVSLAQQIFSDLQSKSALLIGAGETITLVAEHLQSKQIGTMAIANRTLANAEILAARFGADTMQLTDISSRLADYDIVISSTGSTLPVIGKGAVEAAIKQRKRKPMFMVDIAVPRDIEVEVGELPDVYLYSVDDLSSIIEVGVAQRQRAAVEAEGFVTAGADRYLAERRVQQDKNLLTEFRTQANQTADQELERALRDLGNGADAEDVLRRLTSSLTNKLIHPTTAALRNASASGRSDQLMVLKDIFGLGQGDVNNSDTPLDKPAKDDV